MTKAEFQEVAKKLATRTQDLERAQSAYRATLAPHSVHQDRNGQWWHHGVSGRVSGPFEDLPRALTAARRHWGLVTPDQLAAAFPTEPAS